MSVTQGAVTTTTPALPATPTPAANPAPGIQNDGTDDRHVSLAGYSDDPDERVLAAARAEAEAEDGTAPAQPAQQPAPRQQQPAQQQPPAQAQRPQQPTAPQGIMVPKGRLDEVLRQKAALEAEVTYLRGAADARQAMAQQPGAQQPAQQPVQPNLQAQPIQVIAEQEGLIFAAAKKFDAGEITMEQFVSVQAAANAVISNTREQALLAAVPRTPQFLGIADQDILARHAAEMEAAHPWCKVLSQPEFKWIEGVVRNEQQNLGTPIGLGPVETIRLRTAVAALADVYGPRWYPHRTAEVDALRQPTAQQQPPRQQQPQPQQLSPQAQAGARKLQLAAQQPPNINHAGSPGNSADLITPEQVAQMSTDEIEALPPQLRQRIMSG